MCLVVLSVVAANHKKIYILFKKKKVKGKKNVVTSKAKYCAAKLEARCDWCACRIETSASILQTLKHLGFVDLTSFDKIKSRTTLIYLQHYIFPFRQALHKSSESLSGGFVTDVFSTSNLTAWLFQATSNLIAVGTSHGLALIFGKLKIKFRVFCILMILKKPQRSKKAQPELELQGGFLLMYSFVLNVIFLQ